VRGEKSATKKAIPNKASNPNKTSVQIPGLSAPVTGTTPGVPTTTTVWATTVTAGGITVSSGGTIVFWNFTVDGAAGDPNALKNKPVRIKMENKTAFSFIVTPFGMIEFLRGIFYVYRV
jgi:hypothetical protein